MASLQYQRDRGRDLLECRSCGETFPEGKATNDGWHYECPECNERPASVRDCVASERAG
ncbi:hypothetical protein [Halogeometricum sp. CBA1124]|uniref:hypothetical protein n=1 Tax=Halogeometricum sp. CBA1124 TaxID=2668071 RepID=UPI0018D25F48|nr:hypothetical protein [Halogeometricum sp. CBA1124]